MIRKCSMSTCIMTFRLDIIVIFVSNLRWRKRARAGAGAGAGIEKAERETTRNLGAVGAGYHGLIGEKARPRRRTTARLIKTQKHKNTKKMLHMRKNKNKHAKSKKAV